MFSPDTTTAPEKPGLSVEINVDPQVECSANLALIERAAKTAAALRGFLQGQLGIRITDDESIQEINRQFLSHDYATDVISFGYVAEQDQLEGELVASLDTARTRAGELGWSVDHELVLYVVHGVLHITGMDDHEDQDRAAMRRAENEVMTHLGIGEIARFGVDSLADPRVSSAEECEGPRQHGGDAS